MAAPTTAGPAVEAGIRGIEVRSIDYVPGSERHGKVWHQGPFWFLGNFQFFTITIGFIGVGLGLSVRDTIIAGTLGIIFGTLFMAFHATQGPHLGLPQMIQSRAQLGYSGVVIALIGSFVTYLLFNVVDVILLGSGLNGIFGWNAALVVIATTVIATALAIYGHDLIHRVFRLLFFVSLPFYVILTAAIITGHAGGSPVPAGTSSLPAWIAMFTAAAAYNITYAPYVSDYSRYLPRETPTTPIVVSVFSGAAGAAIWLIALGAWLAASLGATDGLVALRDGGNNVFNPLGTLLAILSVLVLIATMGINAYGGMLSVVTAIDSVQKVTPTRNIRIYSTLVLAVIWAAAGLTFGGNAVAALFNSLIVMLYLLVPWTAINLVDYFFVRRGRYAILDFFRADGIYGRWGRRGLTAFVVGLVAMAPFFVIPGVLTGPAAAALGGVDVSAIVGLLVSGLVYFALTRSLDLAAEQPAIEASERTIATEMP